MDQAQSNLENNTNIYSGFDEWNTFVLVKKANSSLENKLEEQFLKYQFAKTRERILVTDDYISLVRNYIFEFDGKNEKISAEFKVNHDNELSGIVLTQEKVDLDPSNLVNYQFTFNSLDSEFKITLTPVTKETDYLKTKYYIKIDHKGDDFMATLNYDPINLVMFHHGCFLYGGEKFFDYIRPECARNSSKRQEVFDDCIVSVVGDFIKTLKEQSRIVVFGEDPMQYFIDLYERLPKPKKEKTNNDDYSIGYTLRPLRVTIRNP